MKKLLIVLLPMMFILCSCSSSNSRHLGTWKAAHREGEITLTFEPEKMTAHMPDQSTISGRYTIDYTKTPIHLDFIIHEGDTAKCIMEFLGKDAFRIIDSANDRPRPAEFAPAEDVLIFKRVIDNK